MKKIRKSDSLPQIEGWLSILLNILLFILKYWAGVVTGSIAILADAWHTLSDSFTSIIVLIGVKLSKRPANEEHPFGFGRAELIASIIISVLLFVVGFNFIIESFVKLSNHEITKFGNIAIIVIDGAATANVIRAAEDANVQIVIATNFQTTDTKIKLLSL